MDFQTGGGDGESELQQVMKREHALRGEREILHLGVCVYVCDVKFGTCHTSGRSDCEDVGVCWC